MFIYVSNQDQKFFWGDLKIRVRVWRRPIVWHIKTYQENKRNPTEKELGQSELPVKRKRQKTIRKYHFPEIC